MAYTINKNDGTPVLILDQELNSTFSIDLVGRNYEDYGLVIAQTQLSFLENFASTTPPLRATSGQLWFDLANNVLRVYRSNTAEWRTVNPVMADTTAPAGSVAVDGSMYYNKELDQLYIHDGDNFKPVSIPGELSNQYSGVSILGNPAVYGSRIRNIFLIDSIGIKRSVLAVVYTNTSTAYFGGEQIVAIISGHAEFEIGNADSSFESQNYNFYGQLTEPGGIGTSIKPGINLRADNETRVPYADLADRALTSYQLNVGSVGSDGANILASAVYHSNTDSVPAISNMYDLGAPANVFAQAYITDIRVGDGTVGSILPNGNSEVNIGTDSAPITSIYVTDLTVAGDIILPANGTVGTPINPVYNSYFETINVDVINVDGYTLPTAAGNVTQTMYIDTNGDVHWANVASNIADLSSNNNSITVTYSPFSDQPVIGGDIVPTWTVDIQTNDTYVRNLFSAGANISYDANTGIIALAYNNPFEGLVPGNFVRTTTNQTIQGVKTFSNATVFSTAITVPVVNHSGLTFASNANITFTTNGGIIAPGDVSGLSDISLKENIVPISDALNKLSQLQGYTFTRTDLNNIRQAGVIAQEVANVLPEASSEHNGLKTVCDRGLVALLIQAVNELSAEVTNLKAQLGSKE